MLASNCCCVKKWQISGVQRGKCNGVGSDTMEPLGDRPSTECLVIWPKPTYIYCNICNIAILCSDFCHLLLLHCTPSFHLRWQTSFPSFKLVFRSCFWKQNIFNQTAITVQNLRPNFHTFNKLFGFKLKLQHWSSCQIWIVMLQNTQIADIL